MKLKIGIIGLGYVGLPLAISFAKKYQVNIDDINYRLGVLLYKNDYYKDAMEPLRQYIIQEPDSNSVLEKLGNIFIDQLRFQESIDVYNRLITIFPDNIEYIRKLADSYWEIGNLNDAFFTYEMLLEFNEEDPEIFSRLGSLALELEDYTLAKKYQGKTKFHTLYTNML